MIRHAPGTLLPSPAARVWLVALVALLAACKGVRANSHYRYPREVTYGKPTTCPDVRMPPLRDGGVSTDAARCSFADFNGSKVTHLAGKILAEAGPASPGTGVSEVQVTVHRVDGRAFMMTAPGPAIARSVTDAQGNYSVRGVFEPGDVAILVSEPTGEPLAARVVHVEKTDGGSLKGLMITIPLDPRLQAAADAPPPAPPEATPPDPAADPTATPRPPPPSTLRMRRDGAAPRIPDPKHGPPPQP